MLYPVVILAIENSEDREFMTRLYEKHYRIMYAQAYDVLRDRQYIEDVISEACISLMDKIEILTQMECPVLTAYVVSTIRNTALNYGKLLTRQRNQTLRDPDVAFDTLADNDAEVDAEILLREEVARLQKAILQLPMTEQAVLRMKYYGDMSNEEIGRNLGIKTESVRKYLIRARRHVLEIARNAS